MSESEREEVQKYLDMLESDDQGACMEAVREIGRFDDDEAERALEKLLDDENFVLQAAAEKTLQRIRHRKKYRAEERRKLEEEELKKKEQEPQIDLSLLSEEEKQRIHEEEMQRLEAEKRKKEIELKKVEEQRRREEAERQKDEERRRLEAEKRKAEELLREKIRKEASSQIGLVEYQGEMLTPEEVERRKEDQRQKGEIRRQAILRKRKREEAEKRDFITSQMVFEKAILYASSISLVLFGLFALGTALNAFLHFASKSLSMFMFVMMILTVVISAIGISQIFLVEIKINKARIISIDRDTWTFDVSLATHPLASIIRRILFSTNAALKAQFGEKNKESGE